MCLLSKNDYYIKEISYKCAIDIVIKNHYLHRKAPCEQAFGLFESQKRFDMFKKNGFEIMYMNRRIAYFKDYNEQKPSLNPPFSSVYLCSGMLPYQIVFEEIKKH